MEIEKKIDELGEKMNKQNNRLTQYPLFVIQVDKQVPTGDNYADEYVYLNGDSEEIDEKDVCESCKSICYNNDTDCENEDCECESVCAVSNVEEFDLTAGVFFTAEACEEHIRLNNHHYNNPKSYGIGAWRNDEMVNVMKFIAGYKDKKIARFYK